MDTAKHAGVGHLVDPSLLAGTFADLVLLGSNPLDDLDHLTDRVGVMVRGRWVPSEEIDARLEALAAKHAEG